MQAEAYKINEIFCSLQGEGYFSGTAATFIRFSGCNLRCPFCDTNHESGNMLTADDILKEVAQYKASHIVLTGGEPSLFINEQLVAALKQKGYFVQIETNGTNPLPANIDWVTFSPKEKYVLKHSDELKIVFGTQDPSQWLQFDCKRRYLQPESGKETEKVVEYIKQHPQWRLSLQIHKLINIR